MYRQGLSIRIIQRFVNRVLLFLFAHKEGKLKKKQAIAYAKRLFCGYKGIRKLYKTIIPGH
jgi:hypothetical protein